MNRTFSRSIVLCFSIHLSGCSGSATQDALYFPLPEEQASITHSEAQAFVVDTVIAGLDYPYAMEFLPDGKVLITEREGKLRLVENGTLSDAPIRGAVPTGLRDVKLHPQYAENGWIYLSHYVEPTDSVGGFTVLTRARIEADSLLEAEELYRAGEFQENGGYFGSRIGFDDEGYLYFLVGGRTLDERHRRINIQALDNPSGKTMRLHDDGRVPTDNPYVTTSGALPEIYSYGHRQHQGIARHPQTGQLWLTEHGENGGDELNVLRKGANYGWPLATHSLEYDGAVISEDPFLEGTEPPVHFWTPAISPGGLEFVTGDRYPGWEGNLFTGSLVQKMLNRSVIEGERVVHEEKLLPEVGRVRSVRVAPDGFLYLLTEDTGVLVRLLPVE